MTRSYGHSILWLALFFFFFEDLSHRFLNSHANLFPPPMCGHSSECSYRGGIKEATRKTSVVRNHGCRVTGAMGPPSVEEREVGSRKSPGGSCYYRRAQLLPAPQGP